MLKPLFNLNLDAQKPRTAHLLFALITFLYFYNFHINDIWTPNESFYAESVREMFESGNFLDIQYNYEPRYNKPPLTYWSMAISSAIFSLNEFALRLPIILFALGSIWITYLFGKRMFGQKGGFYAMLVYALGLQLLAVKQYASPEVPLTFFFTLTMYWFYVAYTERSTKTLMLSYVALGLTVLTKGFPYIIVIGGIIGFFLLLKHWNNWRSLLKELIWLKLPLGLIFVGAIGLSWVIYMYISNGEAFWEVYYRETFGRALEKKSNGLKPFFYVGVIAWSIIPYSLSFFYGIYYWIKNRRTVSKVLLPIAWITVMFVIFTISKGKIPTYIIQAHPAFALFIVPMFLNMKGDKVFNALHIFMTFLLSSGTAYIIFELDLSLFFYLIPFILIVSLVQSLIPLNRARLHALPFWSMYGFLIVFSSFLPKMEEFRPYDQIGEIVNNKQIKNSTPLLLDAWLIHNLPYYTQREALRDQSVEDINTFAETQETLAFLPVQHVTALNFDHEVLWKGYIYNFASESQFFKYVMAVNQAKKGNLDKFAEYVLVYKP